MSTATVTVSVKNHKSEDSRTSYKLELLNQKLVRIADKWVHDPWDETVFFDDVPFGMYVLRYTPLSGNKEEKIIEVQKQDMPVITFDDEGEQPSFYTTLNSLPQKSIVDDLEIYIDPSQSSRSVIRLWNFSNDKWHPAFNDNLPHDPQLDTPYRIDKQGELQAIEILRRGFEPKYVILPILTEFTIQFQETTTGDNDIYPLEVIIQLRNKAANTLLQLLNQGNIKEARSLYNAEKAERLLFEKMEDANAAAIGGYFLLKIRELDRMHNWAANLADRFPGLPDGPIIHAWQLIQTPQPDTNRIQEIKTRFRQALRRGTPVYAEGVRLLYEGLQQLSGYYKQQNTETKDMLRQAQKIISLMDWSETYTTLLGALPDADEMDIPSNRTSAIVVLKSDDWRDRAAASVDFDGSE